MLTYMIKARQAFYPNKIYLMYPSIVFRIVEF